MLKNCDACKMLISFLYSSSLDSSNMLFTSSLTVSSASPVIFCASFGERAPLNLKLQLVDCCCSLIGLKDYSKVLFVDDNPALLYNGTCSLLTGEISQFLLNGASRFFAFGIDYSLNTSSSPTSSSLPFSNKLN